MNMSSLILLVLGSMAIIVLSSMAIIWVIENIVTISIVIGLIILGLYLIYSFFISIVRYFNVFIENISLQDSKDIDPLKELAFENYFFRKSFVDLKNNFKIFINEYHIDSLSKEYHINSLPTGYHGEDPLLIGRLTLVSLFALIHLIFISLFFLILYIIRLIVYTFDASYLIFRKFFATCPSCHTKTMVPTYECDNCKVSHKKLYPNEYGFFYHKCQCGTHLPAIFFLGRKKLKAKCSNCNNFLSQEFIEARKIFIPIIGGASVGKTNFMFSVVRNFIEKDEYRKGFQADFSDNNTKAKYEKVIKDIKNNFLPQKTASYLPKAFNIILTQAKKRTWTFYLYDAAGEAFRDMNRINIQKYNEYSSGIIFIIDPFSLEKVRKNYKNKLSTVAASQDSIDDILSRLLTSLESTSNLKKTEKYKKPFAIILNKIDKLEDEIINKDSKKGKEQLEAWGENHFLQKISVRFENVKFFSFSTMKSLKNTQNDIMDPVMWIANNEGFGKK